MKLRNGILLAAIGITFVWRAAAQNYDTNGVVVQTFAGSGFSGWVDGIGEQTMFGYPRSIVADSQGNLFVLEGYEIRKITPDGTVSTFAGGGEGALPGYGTNVSLPLMDTIAIDHSNTLWISSYSPRYLLRIGSDAYVTQQYIRSIGPAGGVCVDSVNNIYVTDSLFQIIYRYRTNAVWEVFAGSGNSGSADGNGIFTSFNNPTALAADAADNIYVWDSGNQLIRRINPNRDVVTIAGKNEVWSVYGMCVDGSGNVILACGSSILKMTASTNVLTMAGSFEQTGYANGAGSIARFGSASGVCVSQDMIFVADAINNRIRKLTFNPTPQPVSGANLDLSIYPGLRITGVVGRSYRIESSADTTNWITMATVLLTSSPYLWLDENPVSGRKFYRAFLLP